MGGIVVGRKRMANVLASHAPKHQMGCVVRSAVVQRSSDGRVRGGLCGFVEYPGRYEYAAIAY